MAIIGAAGQSLRRHHAIAARFVFNDNTLANALTNAQRKHARHGVGQTAWGIGHDELHRLGEIKSRLRIGGAQEACQYRGRRSSQ